MILRLKLLPINTNIIQRASSYSYKEIDTHKWMEPDEKGSHFSNIEIIFAILQAAKTTPMLIWSLCYHGKLV